MRTSAALREKAALYRDIAQSWWIVSERPRALRADRRAELLEAEAERVKAEEERERAANWGWAHRGNA